MVDLLSLDRFVVLTMWFRGRIGCCDLKSKSMEQFGVDEIFQMVKLVDMV
jgi:hypothetical protein